MAVTAADLMRQDFQRRNGPGTAQQPPAPGPPDPTPPGSTPTPDASTTVKGVVRLSAAPIDPLNPIAAGATDSRLSDPRTPLAHAHVHTDMTDFVEAVQDVVGQMVAAGANVTATYDDTAGTLTIAAAGGGGGTTDVEVVRDTIGAALAGAGLISVVVNDAADTITISTTATQNATDAQLRDRTTHTGTQAPSTIAGTAVVTADSRLSDARTPTSHAASHKSGGADQLRLDELAAPTTPIDLNTHRLTGLANPSAASDAVRNDDSRFGVDATARAAAAAAQASADAAPPTIVAAGNLGATRSQALTSRGTWISGTLTANHTLTLTGLTAGYVVRLLLTQDATGGRTLTISDGTTSQAVTVNSAAGIASIVECLYDGTDLYVKGA